jgi:hypothetical protein
MVQQKEQNAGCGSMKFDFFVRLLRLTGAVAGS